MKYFIKFFEIGKIDKGLFRIWIVLTFIYSIFAIAVFYDSEPYRDYSKIKNFNLETAKTTYCKKQNYYRGLTGYVKIEWYGLSESITFTDPMHIGYSRTFKECFIGYTDLKDKFYKNYISFIFILVSIPFIVALVYLIIKKIFIWVYRGFK